MLNLFHLKYFSDAARSGSMTVAAQRNGLTRPGVSQAIKNLEDQLGVRLIEHKKREFALTAQGRRLMDECDALFDRVDELKDQIASESQSPSGPLSVGCSRSLASYFLPTALERLHKKHSALELSLTLGITREICVGVRNRSLDVGLVVDDGSIGALRGPVVARGRFICVKRTKGQALDQFLVTEARPETLHLRKILATSSRYKQARFLEVKSWDLIAEFASHGLGIGLVPDFMLNSPKTTLTKISQLSPCGDYEVVAVQRRPSTAGAAFLAALE